MEPKVNYWLVGAFVVLLGIGVLAVVLWLGKADYQAYDRYYAYMRESVAGLSLNAPVKYHGVEVGTVVEIILNPDNPEEVRLTLDILRGTPIKEDTVAVQHVQGLTGFAIIDLTGGSRDAPVLQAQPGQPYPVIQTRPSLLARLDEEGSRLIINLNRLTDNLQTLTDEPTRTALAQIVSDLAVITKALQADSARFSQGVAAAAQTSENALTLSQTLNDRIPELLNRLVNTTSSLETMVREMTQTSRTIGRVVDHAGPNIEQFSQVTLAETGQLVTELRTLTGNLNRLVYQLEREPNALLFGRAPKPRGPGE